MEDGNKYIKCPFCGKEIDQRAKRCKYCKKWLTDIKQEQIECPYCCNIVEKESTICPHCNSDLNKLSTNTVNKEKTKTKKNNPLVITLILLGVLALIIIVPCGFCGICGSIPSSDYNNYKTKKLSNTNNTTVKVEPTNKPKPKPTEPQLSTETVVDKTRYTLKSYRFANYIGDSFYGEKPDGKFLIVKLSVENESDSSRTIGLSSAEVINLKGYSYSTSSEGGTALSMSGDDTAEVLLSEIHPGLTKEISIVFDVPPSDSAFKLKIPSTWGKDGYIKIGN